MSLEQNSEQHHREVPDKFVDPVDDYQMKTYDYVVRPTAPTKSITVTLPPVAEARGRFYSVICMDVQNGWTVTLADKNDSECWLGDMVLNAKCDGCLLYSDGRAWFVVSALLAGELPS